MNFFEDFRRFGNKVALISEQEQISYVILQDEIELLQRNYNRRELAFCVCTNTIESIEGYLSFLQAEIPVVLINYHTDQERLEHLIDTYRPYYFWMPKNYLDMEATFEHRNYGLVILEKNKAEQEMHKELAVLLTTSGSTGSPKLVRQSYKNIQANAESIVEYLKIRKEDRVITTLPMHYTYGLSIINTHLLCGATIVLTDAAVIHPQFWHLIKEHQVTTFGGVPYTYEMLKKIRFLKRDLSSVRYLTQAGGKLGKEMHLEMACGCAEKGIEFIVMYGQTEATARMSYVPAEHAIDKAGSIGIPIPGGKFWLEDSEGNRIQQSEVAGELIYQGENVTMGYAVCREDLEKAYEHEDILHTGDMAKYDDDGYYYVIGRKKRFLKIFGNRVNLDEVEGLLKKFGIECVVGGQDDHMKIYVLQDENREYAEKYILQHTLIPKFGFSIHVIERIPRNEAGKIVYAELEKIE